MLKTWAQVHVYPPRNEEEVRSKVIWNNTFTSSPRQILSLHRWNRWAAAGIIVVNDICHPTENRLLGQEEIAHKFGIKVNFLDALSIWNSIPYSWRGMLSENHSMEANFSHSMLINQKVSHILHSGPKGWYTKLIKTQMLPIKRQDSWLRELNWGDGDPPLSWPNIYTRPYKTTRETKMQSFFFKMHRLVPCNKYLSTIRIKQDPSCQTCKEEDSISHFFVNCEHTRTFWNKLSEWCKRYLDFSLSNLSVREKLFGLDPTLQGKNIRVINWLTLHAKYFIQKRKLFFQGDLSLIGFLAEIRAVLATERMACGLENRPRKFRPWWGLYRALG